MNIGREESPKSLKPQKYFNKAEPFLIKVSIRKMGLLLYGVPYENIRGRMYKVFLVVLFIVACLWARYQIFADNLHSDRITDKLFSPSNAQTQDGTLIPVEQFFSATRCATCHQDTHKGWSESLHRNAAREPFYRESADILLRTRGIEFTRHCESCHTPVALFSGALRNDSPKKQSPFTELDHEGVTCSVCHSITEARLDGTGSFTIRRPALLAREDGTPIFGDFTDEQILADIPGHKRAMMRPLLRQSEFCATCHKVDAPPTLNSNKHVRGFSAYDDWQHRKKRLHHFIGVRCELTVVHATCHTLKVIKIELRKMVLLPRTNGWGQIPQHLCSINKIHRSKQLLSFSKMR